MRIIKFEKKDCAPCTSVSQYLDMKNIHYEKVNPFDDPEEAIKFRVMSVPVVVLLGDDGAEIKRSVGFNTAELADIVNELNGGN